MGAHGLAVAAAFAVALAVLVSVSPTPTAEAADIPLLAANNSATAAPGDTVQITVVGSLAQVSITGTGDGVGGSFAANGGQSINCADDLSCDEDETDGTVQVDLDVDEDSGEGYILVSVEGIGGDSPTAKATKVITVSKGTLLGSLKAETSSKTIAANDDDTTPDNDGPNEADILATVKNAATTPAGLDGQRVTFVTTLGTLACPATTAPTGVTGATDTVAVSGVQVCSIWTNAIDNPLDAPTTTVAGLATVRLDGAGREGVATVTVTVGGLTDQLEVTMYGKAKNLSAEPMQGSVEIGGDVYIVLTVTDAAGNPVSGQVIAPVSSKEVVGPGDDAVPVVTSKGTTASDTSDGSGYNVDFIHPRDSKQNLPACGDDEDPVTDTSDPPTTTEDFANDGTNADGKCVVHVRAPEKADGDPKDATRGVHTLNFQVSSSIKASATIEVAGKPASISTDAPDPIEPTSVTEITVSVFDDEDVLVGITSVKVRKIGGDGLIEDHGEDGSEMTSNGQSKFTFIAPSRAGSSEILITAGDVNHRLTLNIGEAMPEEEPAMPDDEEAMPEGDALSFLSPSIASFSGGSVEDLAAAAEAACPGGATFWVEASDRSWAGYRTTAIAIANTPFNAAWAGGIPATAVFFTECEADAMDSEGAMGG